MSSALSLQAVAGLEDPPDDGHAQRQEHQDGGDADLDIDVGQFKEAPAETADQIDNRVEQRHGAPERRQDGGRVESTAQKGQRRDDQKRRDLELVEAVGPDAENEAEQAE